MGMSEYYRNLREKIGDELLFVPSVAGIIRNDRGEILFGRKHKEQHWGLIAGAIELGETPAQAMIREAYEETGLEVEPTRIIGVYGGKERRHTYSNGHQVEYLTIVFECRDLDGKIMQGNEEMCELRYFNEHKLPSFINNYPEYIFSKDQVEAADFEKK